MHSYAEPTDLVALLAPVDDCLRCAAATGAVMQHGRAPGRLQQVVAGAMVTR